MNIRLFATKLLLVTFSLTVAPLGATMVYDPTTNQYWSEPRSPKIDQMEYMILGLSCNIIEKNIEIANGGLWPTKEVVMDQNNYYLTNVGTPTALRLAADLKEDRVIFPNGTFMSKAWKSGSTDYDTLVFLRDFCEKANADAAKTDRNYHRVKIPALLPNLY